MYLNWLSIPFLKRPFVNYWSLCSKKSLKPYFLLGVGWGVFQYTFLQWDGNNCSIYYFYDILQENLVFRQNSIDTKLKRLGLTNGIVNNSCSCNVKIGHLLSSDSDSDDNFGFTIKWRCQFSIKINQFWSFFN